MNNLSVKLNKSGKGFLLSVSANGSSIVSNHSCTNTDLMSDQLTIMKMVEGKIRSSNLENKEGLIQELSYAFPMSIMSELRGFRKR